MGALYHAIRRAQWLILYKLYVHQFVYLYGSSRINYAYQSVTMEIRLTQIWGALYHDFRWTQWLILYKPCVSICTMCIYVYNGDSSKSSLTQIWELCFMIFSGLSGSSGMNYVYFRLGSAVLVTHIPNRGETHPHSQ